MTSYDVLYLVTMVWSLAYTSLAMTPERSVMSQDIFPLESRRLKEQMIKAQDHLYRVAAILVVCLGSE